MSTPACAGLQRVIGVYRKNRKNNVSSPTDQGCLICEETVKLVKVGAVVHVVCACARARVRVCACVLRKGFNI